MAGMKTCLGTLILVPAILGLAVTVAFHASVDADIRFEERDTNAQYINTERSYRPVRQENAGQDKEAKPRPTPAPAQATQP